MPWQTAPLGSHPPGEPNSSVFSRRQTSSALEPASVPLAVHGQRICVEGDPSAPVTPLGQLVYFSQFLAGAGLFGNWVKDRSEPVSERAQECCGAVEQPAVLEANLGADIDTLPQKGSRWPGLVRATGMGARLAMVQIARKMSPHPVPMAPGIKEIYTSTAVFRVNVFTGRAGKRTGDDGG